MIVSQLYEYICQQGTMSQAQLAQHFGVSADGIDAMLDIWIQKGKLSRLLDTNPITKKQSVRYAVTKDDGLSVTVTM
ncbi:iron transporter FeoC [Vibrio astriarenae]|uniref:Iron transporter FeoC n=1 Tax=Vibrio astriarenae TaxID=1481923 RepID=A0A7Z2YDB9_9VIBR|nr:FeoC-like transcriptional regulator [Vibrio astriarenae]QIA62840.1 iron transporter FeoC [Vibrio astriarenae]